MIMETWGKIKTSAKYAGVCGRTFRPWLKMGLKHSRLPSGTVLVKFVDIDRFLDRYEVSENRVDKVVAEIERELDL